MRHCASSFKVWNTSTSHRIQRECVCIMHRLCVIVYRVCELIPPSEASVHHSPGYGLFEEPPLTYADTVLQPPPLTSWPPLPLFASTAPPRPFLFSSSSFLCHFDPFPLPLAPSLVTGLLTASVYNKAEDESWPCVCGKHQRWTILLKTPSLSFIAHDD